MMSRTAAAVATFDAAVPLREAARLAGVHVDTLRDAVRLREVAAVRHGARGHIRIRLSEIDRWLRRQTIPARRNVT